MYFGALGATRDNERAQHFLSVALAEPRAIPDELPLVVVDGKPGRLIDETAQIVAVEHRKSLTRIEDERDVRVYELAGVLDHAFPSIGRYDANGDAFRLGHIVEMRHVHGAGVKGRNLIGIEIGGDEGLRGKLAVDYGHMPPVDVAFVHPRTVAWKVLAHGRHGQRVTAQQLEIVGNVSGTPAKFLAHLRHQERHAQHMHLVRQDVILEAIVEHHDVVIGNRTANQSCHGNRSVVV